MIGRADGATSLAGSACTITGRPACSCQREAQRFESPARVIWLIPVDALPLSVGALTLGDGPL